MKSFNEYEIKLAKIIYEFKELTNFTLFISNINERVVEFTAPNFKCLLTRDFITHNKSYVSTNQILKVFQYDEEN